jgi:RNA-directed DNA polymerase
MDLSKCFDTLNHDLILRAFRRRIADGSILRLIRMFLQGGVMLADGWRASEEGSPQGGVISPFIANVHLDAFDQQMKERGHRIVRYGDDILILTGSKSAAHNALKVARGILEGELLLSVNEHKTSIVHRSRGVKFLSVVIHTGYTRIKDERLKKFNDKVRSIIQRNSPVNQEKVIGDLNPVTRGFANYLRVANCQKQFRELDQWIRRRLRAKQLKLWKKPKRLHRKLRQLCHQGEFQAIKMSVWRNSTTPLAHYAISNSYLRELGLFEMGRVKSGTCLRSSERKNGQESYMRPVRTVL